VDKFAYSAYIQHIQKTLKRITKESGDTYSNIDFETGLKRIRVAFDSHSIKNIKKPIYWQKMKGY
jgi:hypothetical protein